ncbi:DUF6678 family protein [Marinobacter shengliensis]|uniref:DUF6678 family protein n=1 Tax=Marinobacter shengliensis TaxID=1389223 RepID=A0ABV4WCP5_9GAMM
MNLRLKSKLTKYLEENQISSVLNDSKWERLFELLREIEGALDFQRKDLDEPEPDESYWDGDLYHVMGEWQRIEWLNIRALVSESKGALLQPVVTDRTDLLIQALEKAGTPFERLKDGVRIWGYLRPGVSPQWANT